MKAKKKRDGKWKRTQAFLPGRALVLGLLIQLLLAPVSSKAQVTATAGSYIVDLGTAVKNPAGVKPYGMVHELIKFYKVPIYWIVRTGKAKDAVDYTIEGRDYKSGLFVIPGEFVTPNVQAAITQWTAATSVTGPNGYIRGFVTARRIAAPYSFTGAKFMRLTSAPLWTLDDKNGSIAEKWIKDKDQAGIPSTQYNWLAPSALGACNDVFVMPHADPTWADHGNLYNWNLAYKGAIWLGCHAGSALHNTYNPANTSQQMNFLTSKVTTAGTGIILPVNNSTNYSQNSLILWGQHKGGSTPYNTNSGTITGGTLAAPDDWVSQFMDVPDRATTGGSENIYLPVKGAQWLSSTHVITYDPTQEDVPAKSDGPAVVMAYGRGFGDNSRGWVMMEAGHDIGGTDPDNIAAERAFFNWSFLAALDKTPVISNLNTGVTPAMYLGARTYQLSLNYSSPVGASLANVVWSAVYTDDGVPAGVFTPNGGVSNTATTTSFVPFSVESSRQVVFTVTVYDNCGRFNIESWTGTVFNIIANPDINRTVVNKPVTGSVATNDKAPAGVMLSYSNPAPINGANGLPNPSNAVPVLNPDGTYTFTTAVPGVYSFNVDVCSDEGACQPQILTITVTDEASNQNPPVANTDLASTPMATPVNMPILLNDYAGNMGGSLGAPSIATNPLHGTATIVNGELRYTPAAGFSGRDTVIYQVCETPSGFCTKAYAIIDVKPAGGANTTSAADDYNQTVVGVPVNGSVKNNDKDAEGNTQSITPQTITNSFGELTLDANGNYIYKPAAGFTGTAWFPYTTTDNGTPNAVASATLYIYVNIAPGFSYPDINHTTVNKPVTGDVSTNDKTPAGMTFTYSDPVPVIGADGQPNPSGSVPQLNPDGSYTFTTTVPGVYSYNVKVCTGTGLCELQNLTITVTDEAIKNPPTANTDIASTKVNTPVSVPLLVNDYPGNIGGNLLTPGIAASPLHGTASIVGGELLYTPAAGFSGRDTVIYQVCENPGGLCTRAYAIIDVIPDGALNTTSAADDYAQTKPGISVSGDAKANDKDAEGNTQSITPQHITNSFGEFTIDANGKYTYKPAPGFTGTAWFPYTVTDNGSPKAAAEATIYISVEGVLSGFGFPDINRTTVNKPVTGDVSTNDKIPVGTTLSYSNPTPVIGADGQPNPSDAVPVIQPDGSYTFTAAVPGVYSYNVQVCTNTGTCEPQNLTITVTDEAAAKNPPIANTDLASTTPGTTVNVPLVANDYPGNGSTLNTPTIATNPLHGTAGIVNGQLQYTPTAGFSGRDTVVYQVCESSSGLCTKAYAIIDVKPAGEANITSAADDYNQTKVGITVGGDVKINDKDPEGNAQSIVPQNITNSFGTFIVDANGNYTYKPAAGFAGTAWFPYTVTDDGNPKATSEATVYIFVKQELDTNPDNNTGFVNKPIPGNVSTNDQPTGNIYGGGGITTVPGYNNPGSEMPVLNGTSGTYTFQSAIPGVYKFNVPVCLADQSICGSELLTITVLDPATTTNSPVAMNDAAQTPLNTPVTIDVKANDLPGNTGGVLGTPNLTGTTAPQHGTVSVDPLSGKILYTPNNGYTGVDAFTYNVCETVNGVDKCVTAQVKVDVLPANTPVINAADDYNKTTINVPVSGTVSSNDGAGQSVTTAKPLGGTTGTAVGGTITDGKGNKIVFNADGSGNYDFTPEPTFTGTAAFEYTSCKDGNCVMATLYITVSAPLVPDLTPSITILPANAVGEARLNARVRVAELVGVATDGSDIRVFIPKSPKFTLAAFNPTLRSLPGLPPFNNSNWTYVGEVNGRYLFKLGGTAAKKIFDAGEILSFGITINFLGQSTVGIENITVRLYDGDGGDSYPNNNGGSGKVEHGIKP
ncbi:Ig-like domain-containing protein [Niabella hirudinis]|uniref:Ig-like domain-containing protein n=1 Tax=Niabella hirudinis TaxID=1285929 RepID=UPI003EB6C6F2